MLERDTSVILDVLIQPQAGRRTREQVAEQRLARGERVMPQVVSVKLDQVEGVQENAIVVPAIPDALKIRDPVVTTSHRFAVDDTRTQAQLGQCLHNQRKATGRVVTRPAVELNSSASFSGDNPEAVVLDLV